MAKFINVDSKKEYEIDKENCTILKAMQEIGIVFSAPCGGNHSCKKCLVKVKQKNKEYECLACNTLLVKDMIIYFKDENKQEAIKKENNHGACSLCLDLGTTTLVFYVINKNNKEVIYTNSLLNPQAIYGSDVIARVSYANEYGLINLHKIIIDKINEIISSLNEYNLEDFYICGNPIMLHIVANIPIKSFGFYPYSPIFLKSIELDNIFIIPFKKIKMLPSFSSFVGADIAAGVLATNLPDNTNLLIDLGTNGEMVLAFNNKLYVTSTAAGPAFEGAEIECGCGGISGAISKIYEENKLIKFATINNKEAIGLTGAALIDLIAILKDRNIIDDSGVLLDNKPYYLTDKIYITQKDIRKIQLAKSAIRSGIDILIAKANLNYDKINNVYIAGSFGYYLNINSAIKINLLPSALKDKYIAIGNAAGNGCIEYALDENKQKELDKLLDNVIVVDLNEDEDFIDAFALNMKL